MRDFTLKTKSLKYVDCLFAELGTRYLKSNAAAAIWQKSSGAAACRYLTEKVAPLPLLAYKTAAATLQKYLAKGTMAFK